MTCGTCVGRHPRNSVEYMREPNNPGVPGILAEDLQKSYKGRTAVAGLGLRVEVGEVMGLLGANGAGKTTTVEMIAGLRRPDHGRARVLGIDPTTDRPGLRRVLGVQLQDASLHGALTVGELLDLHRSFHADPVPTAELLEMVGLVDERRVRFDHLSGGQQQRTSVAVALAGRPRVLILDEFTTGLDPRARRRLWELVERLRDDGVTVLIVSHAMDEVEQLCDRICVLDEGRIIASGSPAEVMASVGTDVLEDAFLAITGKEVGEEAW